MREGAGSETPPQTTQGSLEQVTFTAYHPRELQLQQWHSLVVYLSLDDPATMAWVSVAAAERFGGKLGQFRPGRSENPTGLVRAVKLPNSP